MNPFSGAPTGNPTLIIPGANMADVYKPLRPRRPKLVLTARAYGLLAASIAILGMLLFFFFAYQAFGAFGILVAAGISALGSSFF